MKSNSIFIATLMFAMFSFTFLSASKSHASLVKDFYKFVDKGDFDNAGALLSDDIKVTIPFSPDFMTKDAYRGMGMAMGAAFPDMKHEVVEISETTNTVSFKGIFSGTNKGMLMGNPPTGNWVTTSFMGYCKVNEHGKFVTMDIVFDVASFNGQLMKGIDLNAKSKEIVRQLLAAADEGSGEKFATFLATNHTHFVNGKQGFAKDVIERIQMYKKGFPDIKRNIERIYVDGNNVIVQGNSTGTHTGQFLEIKPTGAKLNASWMGVYLLNTEGKVEKAWVEMDTKFMNDLKAAGSKSSAKI